VVVVLYDTFPGMEAWRNSREAQQLGRVLYCLPAKRVVLCIWLNSKEC